MSAIEIEPSPAPRQRDHALAFVIEQVARFGVAPSMAEIARQLGVSSSRAKQLVAQLVTAGAIERTPGAVRGLRVRDVAECRMHLADVLRRMGWIAADPLGEIRSVVERYDLVAILELPPVPAPVALLPAFEHLVDDDHGLEPTPSATFALDRVEAAC